jgi:hypothetical protein
LSSSFLGGTMGACDDAGVGRFAFNFGHVGTMWGDR